MTTLYTPWKCSNQVRRNNINFSILLKLGTLTFFVNGDQVKSEVTAPTMNGFNDLGHLFIGGTIDANVCKCHLAEMEIFSRAISDQEVKESYDRYSTCKAILCRKMIIDSKVKRKRNLCVVYWH